MTLPGIEPLLLALWGAIVSLDERGVFLGGSANPLFAGLIAGALAGDPAVGLWTGFLFQAIWPVRIESGGNIPSAGALAAVAATGIAVALGAPSSGPPWFSAESSADDHAHGAFWIAALILGLAVALAARAWERSLRARNTTRAASALAPSLATTAFASSAPAPSAPLAPRSGRAPSVLPDGSELKRSIRVALMDAALRGAALAGVPMLLAGAMRPTLISRTPAGSGWLDSTALWLVPAFLALGSGSLAWALRRPERVVWIDWTLGATLGAGSALLLDQLQ